MRDPSRIPRLVGKLQKLWAGQPDTRLGQLILNHLPHPQADAFLIEDSVWEHEIDAALRRVRITKEQKDG